MRECMYASCRYTNQMRVVCKNHKRSLWNELFLSAITADTYIHWVQIHIDTCCAGVREYLRDCNCSQLKCSETMAVFAVFLDWHTKQKTGTRHIAILPASLTSFSPSLPCFSLSTWRCFSLSEDYEMHSAQCTGGVCGAYVILYRIAHDTLFMLTKKRREESEKERECCSAHINKHVIAQSVS